jgi:hypothetical protein
MPTRGSERDGEGAVARAVLTRGSVAGGREDGRRRSPMCAPAGAHGFGRSGPARFARRGYAAETGGACDSLRPALGRTCLGLIPRDGVRPAKAEQPCLASNMKREAQPDFFQGRASAEHVNTRRLRGELARGRYGGTAASVAGIRCAKRNRMVMVVPAQW